MTVAADIESERTALTKSLTTVGASAPTACGNWTAFDLAAHLVSEERLGDRFSSAAEFDNALALQPRARRFVPVPVHAGHLRCWTAVGKGRDVHVWAIPGPSSRLLDNPWSVGDAPACRIR
jgi:hypothetical protein